VTAIQRSPSTRDWSLFRGIESDTPPTTNDYGKDPHERALILEQLETVEPLLRQGATHELDTARPLAEVVADLIEIADESSL
jgi:hypothetical protein